MQRAQHLRGEPCRDLCLRVAAGLEERRQAAVRGVIVQSEGGENQLQAAEHRPAADIAERADRKLQPAACLAVRSLNEPQFAVGQQEAGGHAGFAQQPLQPLMRRGLPALQRAARLGFHARCFDPHEDLPTLVRVCHRPMWAQLRVALLHTD
jgi:hypothetical protein